MFGLNIHLKSFKLKSNLINENDKIRVSITTFPEQNKEAFVTEAKQINHVHHFFTVNISKETQKIVFVFRKVGFLEDPIIASTIIYDKDFPTRDTNITDMKNMNIYEPVKNGHKNRKVYGEMEVQFSLTSAFPTFNKKENKQNNFKFQAHLKTNGYSKINNLNENYSNSIFNDNYNY